MLSLHLHFVAMVHVVFLQDLDFEPNYKFIIVKTMKEKNFQIRSYNE